MNLGFAFLLQLVVQSLGQVMTTDDAGIDTGTIDQFDDRIWISVTYY